MRLIPNDALAVSTLVSVGRLTDGDDVLEIDGDRGPGDPVGTGQAFVGLAGWYGDFAFGGATP